MRFDTFSARSRPLAKHRVMTDDAIARTLEEAPDRGRQRQRRLRGCDGQDRRLGLDFVAGEAVARGTDFPKETT